MHKTVAVSLALGLFAQVCGSVQQPAQAQSWAEQQARNQERQRQALQQQAQSGYSPNGLSGQALQTQRWEQQYAAEHPGQPMLNPGQLQKLHSSEIQAEIRAGGEQMRARRQADLQAQHQMAKEMKQQALAAQHITWSPRQWANWENEFTLSQKAQADAFLEGIRIRREIDSEDMRRRALGY